MDVKLSKYIRDVALAAAKLLALRGLDGPQVVVMLARIPQETSHRMMQEAYESGVTVNEIAGRWVAVLASRNS